MSGGYETTRRELQYKAEYPIARTRQNLHFTYSGSFSCSSHAGLTATEPVSSHRP